MASVRSILSKLSPTPANNRTFQVHVEDPLAVLKLSTSMIDSLENCPKKAKPIILCIGTDRSTGDSLGPLTGWHLTPLLRHYKIEIFGTVDNPVHAVNLIDHIKLIKERGCQHPIIAVDACLGQVSPVGTISKEDEPLRPGVGLNKSLPAVGDISITGIVNIGGFMEFQVLQNTRLSLVLKMSRIIANSIFLALRKTHAPLPQQNS